MTVIRRRTTMDSSQKSINQLPEKAKIAVETQMPKEYRDYLVPLIIRDEIHETVKVPIGAKARPAMYCPHCGAPAIGNFCFDCGQRLLNEITTRTINVTLIDKLIAENAERIRRDGK